MLLGAPWLMWVGLWVSVGFALGLGIIIGAALLCGVIFTHKKQVRDDTRDALVERWNKRAKEHEVGM